MKYRDLSPIDRGLILGWLLRERENFGTADIVRLFGVARATAYRLLRRSERLLPVVTEVQNREAGQ